MDGIQLSLFSRMSPESIPATGERTGEPQWRCFATWGKGELQFLDLRSETGSLTNGEKPVSSLVTDGVLPTEPSMLNTSVSPRGASVVRLSSILEETVPDKYSLSARACQGILNRAAKRGKELPEELKTALEEVIGRSTD